MAGLSFRARNAINGGYGGTTPETEYGYGVGYADAGYNIKNLKDSLAADFISKGWGTPSQQSDVLSDITGYRLSAPNKFESDTGTTRINNLASLLNLYNYANMQGHGDPVNFNTQAGFDIARMTRQVLGGNRRSVGI